MAALAGWTALAVVMGLLALIAVVDLVVIIRRRAARGDGGSLFE
jgi:hypothetical protein